MPLAELDQQVRRFLEALGRIADAARAGGLPERQLQETEMRNYGHSMRCDLRFDVNVRQRLQRSDLVL